MSHPPLATGHVRPTPGAQLRKKILVPDTARGRTHEPLHGRGAEQARAEGAPAPRG
jgi:hypothetical protein